MIDPLVSLAFSVYSNKGVYALLLGSGVSRAARILTGWDMVLDLIKKIATLEGAECAPDPAAWYRRRHNAEPNYSDLLDKLAREPAERQQLLRGYFEPTEEEREQGLKLPTKAHRAIAKLATGGYVRVIVTTNFDRLTETALEGVGITPTVISTPDQVSGTLPLAHSGVTIVKLHGDYRDIRIRNTEEELRKYDPVFDEFLGRILDEYGLIVCGWSGEWDIALRAAIERCPSWRFSTYWASKSELSDAAKRLANHRRAVVLPIQDADQFFDSLAEKVQSLADFQTPHPLAAKMAVASVKRYLVDPAARIRLKDLVAEETERLYARFECDDLLPHAKNVYENEVAERVVKYNALSEVLVALMSAGCYWGDLEQARHWVALLQRIANPSDPPTNLAFLQSLRRYPALLLFYVGGLSSLAAEKYETLSLIATRPRVRESPFANVVHPNSVMNEMVSNSLPGVAGSPAPLSDYLFRTLQPVVREYLPEQPIYEETFDRFEYLLSFRHFLLTNHGHAMFGRFVTKHRRSPNPIGTKVANEILAQGKQWPPLRHGLFVYPEQVVAGVQKFNKRIDNYCGID